MPPLNQIKVLPLTGAMLWARTKYTKQPKSQPMDMGGKRERKEKRKEKVYMYRYPSTSPSILFKKILDPDANFLLSSLPERGEGGVYIIYANAEQRI